MVSMGSWWLKNQLSHLLKMARFPLPANAMLGHSCLHNHYHSIPSFTLSTWDSSLSWAATSHREGSSSNILATRTQLHSDHASYLRGSKAVRRSSSSISSTTINEGESEDQFWARGGGFDPTVPVESAWTPPSGWYTSEAVARAELTRVFGRGWQVAGNADLVAKPGQYLTGSVGATRYVVARDDKGKLRAFHNVCRHHAAAVATGSGCTEQFTCPYHGWTYGLDGRLQKATRLAGIKDFSARDFGLIPIPKVAVWGHFVLLSLEKNEGGVEEDHEELVGTEWLGDAEAEVRALGTGDPHLKHAATVEYNIPCNWKVYVDNYLDGGYHVPFAHPSLTSDIDMKSYRTQLFERVSIQTAASSGVASTATEDTTGVASPESMTRIGDRVAYAFVYPNFAINRYGPWLETNLVLPLTVNTCKAVFDWFLDERSGMVGDAVFLKKSLAASDQIQVEDESLCAMVQAGLASPAYDVGRYAPSVELGMHHHHRLLHKDLSSP